MIELAAPSLPPDEAARRVASGREPVWLTSPGAVSDTEVDFDLVAADPVEVVRGESLGALQAAWAHARRAWESPAATVAPAREALPVAVGWLSYDLARQWIPLPPRRAVDATPGGGFSGLEFRFFDAVWVQHRAPPRARVWARDLAAGARLVARLEREVAVPPPPPHLGPLRGEGTRAQYLASVARIKDYLRAGDAYQVNLSRRLVAEIGEGDPLWLAAALRSRTPAPHAIWMGARSQPGGSLDRLVIGNSPERFLRVDAEGRIETRPIKGTRARGADRDADAAARAALRSSPKDHAEHVMIVDLERNDLGRVARTGSVAWSALLRVMELPTVHHLVSTISARLRPEVGLEALLEATFPGGSVTGAPKRRAMEIIDELEDGWRGIYTGATGWLGAGGELDLAVAIRTATVERGRLSLSVGGGIVSDSIPEEEWDETEAKARAFQALARS